MTWAAARDRLQSILAVSITTPISETIAVVHDADPRESMLEYPCVVLEGWTGQHRPEGATFQIVDYEQQCSLWVKEESRDQLVAIIEAYQDAIDAVLVADVTLNGNAQNCSRPFWAAWERGIVQDANSSVDVARVPFTVGITIVGSTAYAP